MVRTIHGIRPERARTGHQSGEWNYFKKVVLMLDIGNVKQYYPLLDN
jgi:hypothetical protein